jgi:hypothetical protein
MKSERAVLKVGWASREIVPDGPVALRGQFYERISQYVRDSLTVTALALEQLDDRGQPARRRCWSPAILRPLRAFSSSACRARSR